MRIFAPNIKKLDKDNNIDELEKCLDNKRASVRYRAFVALSGRSGLASDKLGKLRGMSHDPDPWVKTIATLKFTDMGDSSVFDSLLEIIKKGSTDERIALLHVISGKGATENSIMLQVVMSGLIDKKETVRIQAAKTAAAVKSAHLVSYLGEMLHARHHKERLVAAQSLFDIGGEESIDYLIGLLADSHPEVHTAARLYLEKVENEYVKKALYEASFMQLIKDINGNEPSREKTAHYIGVEKIREGLPLLHRACRDRYKGVRIQALRSIAMFRSHSSTDIVEKLLEDRFHDVRLEALNTLEKIGGKKALKAVETSLSDKSREVRRRAGQILGIKTEK